MIKESFKKWRKKSLFSKLTDILFVVLITALLIPEGRMAIGGFVNKIKSQFSQPGLLSQEIKTSENDWNWQMTDQEGNNINLKDLKGKVIFLNLWATWCPPCVGEMPEIQELYEKFKDNPEFAIVAVSNENLAIISTFMVKKGYEFPVYSSQENKPNAFSTNSIPTSFLIDKEGNIVIREVGAMNWGGKKMVKMIKELLEK